MGFNYHVALSAVGNVIAFIVIAYLAVHFLKKEKNDYIQLFTSIQSDAEFIQNKKEVESTPVPPPFRLVMIYISLHCEKQNRHSCRRQFCNYN